MAKGDKTRKRKTVYELVGESRPPFKRGVDPLDDILLDEERELSREIKRMRLEQIVMKRRSEIARMKAGGDPDLGPMASSADFMKMAQLMGNMTPEEQQRVANAYAVLRMADRGQVGGSLGLLGPLLGYARQNPGASEESMLKYLTLMDSQLMKGLELSRALSPGQPEDGTLKLLGLMKEILPLLQSFKGPQQQGIFDAIFLKPEVYNRLRESGIFGGDSAAKGTVDIELEKLRGSRELQIAKWDLELKRDELKRIADDRRTENLLAVFAPLATAFAQPMSQRMQALGQQQAAAHNPVQHNPMPMAPPGNTVNIQCSCGFQGTTPQTDPPQSELVCPECDQVLVANISGSPTEETTVDRSKSHLTGEI